MPVRCLSDMELARLRGWPGEIADEDAVTCFTLSADDQSWLAGLDRAENRLGVAVQLSALPWLGWIPDDLDSGTIRGETAAGLADRPVEPPISTPASHVLDDRFTGERLAADVRAANGQPRGGGAAMDHWPSGASAGLRYALPPGIRVAAWARGAVSGPG